VLHAQLGDAAQLGARPAATDGVVWAAPVEEARVVVGERGLE
jgi:hypothetical protein